MNRSAILAGLVASVLLIAVISYGQESSSERVARIEAMSDTEKVALRSKLERFESLPSEERKRLVSLNTELNQHNDGEELRDVMYRYYDWLKTINSGQRRELEKAPPEERIKLIKKILADQERTRFADWMHSFMKGIKKKELDATHDWIVEDWLVREKENVLAHEQTLYKHRPWLRDRGDRANNIPESHRIFFLWFNMFGIEEIPKLMPSEEDLEELKSKLDAETRKALEADPERQRIVLAAMMRAAMFSKFPHREEDAELQKFYAKMPEEKKAELAQLPPEKFDEKLRSLYRRENGERFFGKGPPGPPPWMRDRDGRRGDGRRGDDRGPGGRGGPDRGGPDRRGPDRRGPDGPDRGPGGMDRGERGPRRPMPDEMTPPPRATEEDPMSESETSDKQDD